MFFVNLLKSGFEGKVYPVNAGESEILGVRSYPKVSAIPDPVDYVIVSVPARFILEVLDDCAAKGVKAVQIFTAGFREAGTDEGRWLEEEVVKRARRGNFRLIGPNCMGIYNPSINLASLPLTGKSGPVALISQSGGVAFRVTDAALSRGVGFSKVVSYGNEVDLGGPELLDYFAEDPETKVILAYLEGTRDGRSLARALIRAGERKPLVVLKGGLTETGVRAAASHTGALGGSQSTWESVFRQAGAIQVDTVDELVGAALVLRRLPKFTGRRMVIITISGGLSVNFTDRAGFWGFEVPELAAETSQKLKQLFNLPGTSVKNPIDMAAAFMMFPIYPDVFRALDEDPETDLIFLVISVEFLAYVESFLPGITDNSVNTFLGAIKKVKKPLVVVLPSVIGEELRLRAEQLFVKAGVAVFESVDRAMKVLNLVRRYHQRSNRKE